jgi:hypothetical protein
MAQESETVHKQNETNTYDEREMERWKMIFKNSILKRILEGTLYCLSYLVLRILEY